MDRTVGVDRRWAAGSVFVTGGYNGTASFGDIELTGTGTSEVFVARLNTAFANQSADLLLRLYASPTPVKQGDLITFIFPDWNRGPNVAYLESLKTQVPEGTTFDCIRMSGTPGLGTCTHPPYQGTGEIVCDENSAMAPNTTWTLRADGEGDGPIRQRDHRDGNRDRGHARSKASGCDFDGERCSGVKTRRGQSSIFLSGSAA